MDNNENNLLDICWKGVLIINSIILIKNLDKIKDALYDIYSSEINNILFTCVCYTSNIYAYIIQEQTLDDTEFTYKCIYDNGMSNNMICSQIHISELHDNSEESNDLLDIITNFSETPNFFIFEFVKSESKCGLIVDNMDETITDINTNNELLFLSVTLEDKNIEYTIDMKKPINYNINSNNVLGINFVKYYANEYFNIELTDDYKIEIMDNNLNILHLTSNNYINITDGSYKLENVMSSETEEETVVNFDIPNQETDKLQITIEEYSPISNHSSVSNLSPISTGTTINYSNRKCGICREVGHTRKKCPKAVLPF
tara:strand:+ start:64 stop:1008 length:945 start_codon:yes stop_codon:yes gene_type:complete